MITQLILYGSQQAQKDARALLENLPQMKRIDASKDLSVLRIMTDEPVKEKSLIPLLAQSGISGFRLV